MAPFCSLSAYTGPKVVAECEMSDPYSPIHCFHNCGMSAGFGTEASEAGDCATMAGRQERNPAKSKGKTRRGQGELDFLSALIAPTGLLQTIRASIFHSESSVQPRDMIAKIANPREIHMLPVRTHLRPPGGANLEYGWEIAVQAVPVRSKEETFVLAGWGHQRVYQRKPLRCSSTISLRSAIVCGRRYWPQAARMALTRATGAAYEAPKEVDSTEVRKTSSQSRASGDAYVSVMPTQ